jgi:hypothetical protein
MMSLSFYGEISQFKTFLKPLKCPYYMNRYVSRQDASPLFGALVHWRDNTLSSQGYTSDGEPLSSGDELSDGEDTKPRVPASRSTWSRWFGRGWSEKQLPSEGPKAELRLSTSSRPRIQSTNLDPLDVRVFLKLMFRRSY